MDLDSSLRDDAVRHLQALLRIDTSKPPRNETPADEAPGCDQGSKFRVDHPPDRVRAESALGENGGFTVHFGATPIYPIQVAEKGLVWMKLRARGTPGHGSLPREDNATVRLADAV